MLRSAPDDFGAYYDAARKTRQVWKWEKMEQTAISQCGSNSASFFLYRRAKFIEKDREERMMKEEQEKKRALEAQQVMEANKAEVDKKLKKNQLKRQKKKERKENTLSLEELLTSYDASFSNSLLCVLLMKKSFSEDAVAGQLLVHMHSDHA